MADEAERSTGMGAHAAAEGPRPASLGDLTRAFASIGVLSFGGAAGQIAMMHRLVVEERRWLDEQRFMHALNYCMLLPGPEAQQLATYIGWLKQGVRGGIIAGLLFILPGALVMLGLSVLYVVSADAPVVEGIFFGIKAAVLALIAQAVIKIAARGLRTPFLIALAGLAFLGLLLAGLPFPAIVIGCGLIGYGLARVAPRLVAVDLSVAPATAAPQPGRLASTLRTSAIGLAVWWLPVLLAFLALGGDSVIVELGLFFSKLAVLTFGGAYALLAWLAQEAVSRGWVTALEMADGLGLAETTPGPTILVNQFVGFLAAWREPGPFSPLVAAVLGALMTTWVTFAPSFLWIFAGAPYVEDLRANTRIAAALRAISAAVVGVVAYLGVWFALHVVFTEVGTLELGPVRLAWPVFGSIDLAAAALALLAFALVFVARLGILPVVAIMAAAGVATRFLV